MFSGYVSESRISKEATEALPWMIQSMHRMAHACMRTILGMSQRLLSALGQSLKRLP
jgi:hypothetical protein